MAVNNEWTRVQIREHIRTRGEFWKPRYPDDFMNDLINLKIGELWDMVIEHDPSRIHKTAQIAISAGTIAYDLVTAGVTDYYMVKGVCVEDSDSPSGWLPIPQYPYNERHDYSEGGGEKKLSRWDIQDGTLYIWPKPEWSGNVLLEYHYLPVLLDSDGTKHDFYNAWVDWVIYACLIECCNKEEQDDSAWQKGLTKAWHRIRRSSPQRRSGPKVIQDVRGDVEHKITRIARVS